MTEASGEGMENELQAARNDYVIVVSELDRLRDEIDELEGELAVKEDEEKEALEEIADLEKMALEDPDAELPTSTTFRELTAGFSEGQYVIIRDPNELVRLEVTDYDCAIITHTNALYGCPDWYPAPDSTIFLIRVDVSPEQARPESAEDSEPEAETKTITVTRTTSANYTTIFANGAEFISDKEQTAIAPVVMNLLYRMPVMQDSEEEMREDGVRIRQAEKPEHEEEIRLLGVGCDKDFLMRLSAVIQGLFGDG